ncbi:TPA: divalent-cation tolerance protein CutA [Candidatus Woesearchaeota archaeon]|nr:divalent-cation tolerance protein CutA [Candidatus Woesearchaeota archaeon]
MIIIYITCKNNKEAQKIAKHLLDKKLIACANILSSKSLYKWKGKLEKQNEAILLLKTTEGKFESVKENVKKLHSYKIPCILKLKADVNSEYLDWLRKEVWEY